MIRSINPLAACFILFIGLQFNFWYVTHQIKPELGVVSEPPTQGAVHAVAMGDDQFAFRSFGFMIQNMGDTWGRFTPLKNYDLSKLSRWFAVMDSLDAKSDVIPTMAAYYFSQTQNTKDVRYMAEYLYAHAMRDIKTKWWWLLQGMYLANHKLNDQELTLKIAKPLMTDGVPVWAQQMLAVTYEKRGEFDDAFKIMEAIRDNAKDISDKDLRYMTYFLEERIHRLEEFERTRKAQHHE